MACHMWGSVSARQLPHRLFGTRRLTSRPRHEHWTVSTCLTVTSRRVATSPLASGTWSNQHDADGRQESTVELEPEDFLRHMCAVMRQRLLDAARYLRRNGVRRTSRRAHARFIYSWGPAVVRRRYALPAALSGQRHRAASVALQRSIHGVTRLRGGLREYFDVEHPIAANADPQGPRVRLPRFQSPIPVLQAAARVARRAAAMPPEPTSSHCYRLGVPMTIAPPAPYDSSYGRDRRFALQDLPSVPTRAGNRGRRVAQQHRPPP